MYDALFEYDAQLGRRVKRSQGMYVGGFFR